jgi:hypothetical protein
MAITAVALAVYVNAIRYPDLLTKAENYFGSALGLVNKTLSSREEAAKDSTIISIMLPSTFTAATSKNQESQQRMHTLFVWYDGDHQASGTSALRVSERLTVVFTFIFNHNSQLVFIEINDIGKGHVRKGIDKSTITKNRKVYDAEGNPERKATNLQFRAKKKFLRIDNKPVEAPRAGTFPEGAETIDATTMLLSQDTVQPGVETRFTETITKVVQAPEEPQVHTLDDDDVIVEAVPGPRTRERHIWIRDKSRSEGSAKTAQSSVEQPKRQSDLLRNQWARALEEAPHQQEIKQRKEARSRREKENTKERRGERRGKDERGDATKRRERETPVYKNRWAL